MKALRKNHHKWTMTDFSGETHTHRWDQDTWTTNDDNHWHDCKAGNCMKKAEWPSAAERGWLC